MPKSARASSNLLRSTVARPSSGKWRWKHARASSTASQPTRRSRWASSGCCCCCSRRQAETCRIRSFLVPGRLTRHRPPLLEASAPATPSTSGPGRPAPLFSEGLAAVAMPACAPVRRSAPASQQAASAPRALARTPAPAPASSTTLVPAPASAAAARGPAPRLPRVPAAAPASAPAPASSPAPVPAGALPHAPAWPPASKLAPLPSTKPAVAPAAAAASAMLALAAAGVLAAPGLGLTLPQALVRALVRELARVPPPAASPAAALARALCLELLRARAVVAAPWLPSGLKGLGGMQGSFRSVVF
mmetsp:Transcript_34293/g.105548  ORF Transcript_34293/g.105548 Transcript_34293/m.105548 type:complete len:305 (+) Transcript_34293:2-916(+)